MRVIDIIHNRKQYKKNFYKFEFLARVKKLEDKILKRDIPNAGSNGQEYSEYYELHKEDIRCEIFKDLSWIKSLCEEFGLICECDHKNGITSINSMKISAELIENTGAFKVAFLETLHRLVKK